MFWYEITNVFLVLVVLVGDSGVGKSLYNTTTMKLKKLTTSYR